MGKVDPALRGLSIALQRQMLLNQRKVLKSICNKSYYTVMVPKGSPQWAWMMSEFDPTILAEYGLGEGKSLIDSLTEILSISSSCVKGRV